MSKPLIRVRENLTLKDVGEVDTYSRLELNLLYNDVSNWELKLSATHPLASDLAKPGAGIRVYRNGMQLLSGLVTEWEEADTGDDLVLTVRGLSDSAYLAWRLCWPTLPWASNTYDSQTGVVETVMHHFVNYNLGANAAVDRRVPNIVPGTDHAAGVSSTGRGRFQTVLEMLQRLGKFDSTIGFQIVQVDNTLQFQTATTTDLTDLIQFSAAFGNLRGYTYRRKGPEFNLTTVGGGGSGTSRTFYEGSDAVSIAEWGRREEFIDRRDTTNTTELGQASSEDLAGASETTELAIDPIDIPGRAYGVDYNLGDKVRVITRSGVTIDDVVRQVKIVWDNDGEHVSPTIGTEGAISPRTPDILRNKTVRKLNRRTKNLERV
jgi:hypothetical protein